MSKQGLNLPLSTLSSILAKATKIILLQVSLCCCIRSRPTSEFWQAPDSCQNGSTGFGLCVSVLYIYLCVSCAFVWVYVCKGDQAQLGWWVFFIRLMNNMSELRKEYQAKKGKRKGKVGGGGGWGNDYQMVFYYCAAATSAAAAVSFKEKTKMYRDGTFKTLHVQPRTKSSGIKVYT